MLNWIALWVGVYLFSQGGPLQNDAQPRRPGLRRRRARTRACTSSGATPSCRACTSASSSRSPPRSSSASSSGARRAATRRAPSASTRRRRATAASASGRRTSGSWRSAGCSPAWPARSTCSAGSSGVATNDIQVGSARLHRDRGRAARAQHGGRHVRRGAAVRRAAAGHVDAQPRPGGLRPVAGPEPDVHHPGPRRPVRDRERGDHLARAAPQALARHRRRRARDRARRPARDGPRTAPGPLLGWAGVVVAIVAALLTLPPFEVRTVLPSAVLVAASLALGLAGGAQRREAPSAGAPSSRRSSASSSRSSRRARDVDSLEVVVTWSALLAATLRYATPLLFAGLGGLVSERAGVVNIGLEGMMLMGAFFAAWGADVTGSWLLGTLIGVLSGMALARDPRVLLHQPARGPDRRRLRAELRRARPHRLPLHRHLRRPGHARRPARGPEPQPADRRPRLHRQGARQPEPARLGRAARRSSSCGSSCSARAAACGCGRSARTRGRPRPSGSTSCGTRWVAVLVSGGLAALGGAFLSIGFVHSFTQNMTAGQGLHRARRDDLRALEAARAVRSRRCCSASAARSPSACRSSRRRPRRSSRRCRTC